MDLDRTLHLYFDWTGATPSDPAIAKFFESGGSDEADERGETRFFLETSAPAREIYAKFAGCDAVTGNDAILDALREVMWGASRVRFGTVEGNYFVTATDLGPSADLSNQDETSTAHDLMCVDLGDDQLTKDLADSRFAVLRLGTPEGTKYVAVTGDGRSHTWMGDSVPGNDTVEIVRALDEAGALPDEAREMMGDAALATLEAGRDEARFPGP